MATTSQRSNQMAPGFSALADGGKLSSDEKFAIFEQWLLDNGAIYPKLELKDYGNEVRGCHTKEQIDLDETIISIPLRCLITVEMGKDTDIGRAIIAANLDLDAPKHIFIMIFMLLDRRNPQSFFKPYYEILPPTLRNMPVFWTEEELEYLKGSFMLTQIDERNLAMEKDYSAICAVASEFALIATLEEFKWARMCVCSRNFGLIVNGLRTAAMVPYADMLNHYRPRETKWQFEDSVQAFTIVSLRGIATGSQVYDSYGQKCNHRFLLNYGFSVEDNRELDGFNPNEVPILVQLYKDDPLYDFKCENWGRDGSFPMRRIRVCAADNECSRVLFSMLRLIEADKEDVAALSVSQGSRFRSMRDSMIPINSKNEMKAMQLLKRTTEDYLSRYPTKYEDDVRRLSSSELSQFSNERHAVIQIAGEKEVLLFYLDLATTAIKLLTNIHSSDDIFNLLLADVLTQKRAVIQMFCQTYYPKLRREEIALDNIRRKSTDISQSTDF